MTLYTLIPLTTGIIAWYSGYRFARDDRDHWRSSYFELLGQAIEDHRARRGHEASVQQGNQGES